MWHSNSPWAGSLSGYGTQTAIWVPELIKMGHEVAISCFHGLQAGMRDWNGITCYPAGINPYGGDVVGLHARHFKADLVITLMDFWALSTETLIGLNVAPLMPVDVTPLSQFDVQRLNEAKIKGLEFRCWPIALTRFGQRQLEESGFPALHVPHGIDTTLWRPPEDRKTLREAMGVDDRFVIFINAANLDKFRKNFPGQMAAFARLHRKHPDTLLVLHTSEETPQGLKLREVAGKLGIEKAVKFSSQYLMKAGMIKPEQLVGSYGMADLYSGCSMAEGFGIPIAEAMSCETPTVVTDGSAMTEVGGPCWKVKGEPSWCPGHDAWWTAPHLDGISRAYEKAYQKGPAYQAMGKKCRQHVLDNYDIPVVREMWRETLKTLEERL